MLDGVWPWLLAVGGVLATMVTVFIQGRRTGKQEAEHDQLQEDVQTAIRIDRVRASDTANAARMRLAERKPNTDL